MRWTKEEYEDYQRRRAEAEARRLITKPVAPTPKTVPPLEPVALPDGVRGCRQCGKQISKRNAKFCSLPCAWQSKERVAHVKPKDRGMATCENCQKTFKLRTNGGVRFCCSLCAHSAIGKKTMAANRRIVPATQKLDYICRNCGASFSAWRSAKRVYCSAACSDKMTGLVGAKTRHASGWHRSHHPYSRARRGWREIGGQKKFFRSRMEANYARYLHWSGVQWEFEPKTFWFDGIKRGILSYTPDFYLPASDTYLELKGWMDAKSRTKLRRMKKYHPHVRLTLVDWKQYKAIERTAGKLIRDWEWEHQKTEIIIERIGL